MTDSAPTRSRVGALSRPRDDYRMRDIEIKDDMIRLGQLLKLAGLAEDGAHAKELLDADEVAVNGEPEIRRGRQVHPGDIVTVGPDEIRVASRR
ncbi:ribosome-associated protein [Actinokineospora alba]|uniref:Ribosome-associated protein n=2 Tax=Actinokineospora alba TaxID=504798 RepID=A0A1H0W299_9PSEU|nr:ribosome-associated protein [Actinokineospora alba]SDI71988.1 ribosome-associated protein [Actinokineospora alba]SDP84834.1 ribosome-associated protein [Actinokineospora alba]